MNESEKKQVEGQSLLQRRLFATAGVAVVLVADDYASSVAFRAVLLVPDVAHPGRPFLLRAFRPSLLVVLSNFVGAGSMTRRGDRRTVPIHFASVTAGLTLVSRLVGAGGRQLLRRDCGHGGLLRKGAARGQYRDQRSSVLMWWRGSRLM